MHSIRRKFPTCGNYYFKLQLVNAQVGNLPKASHKLRFAKLATAKSGH